MSQTNLQTALQADSAAKRWQAIESLNNTKLSDNNILAMLTKLLADEHPFVRWQAGLALAKNSAGNQKLTETLTSNSSATALMRQAAADALRVTQSPLAFKALINTLNSDDALLRQSAVEALANQKNPEAIPHLVKALNDPVPWVRRAAAYALGHVGNQETAGVLITALRDSSVLVRRSAAYALGARRAKVALAQLKLTLSDKDALTRRNAAWALGRIGLPEAVPNLNQLLNDPALDGSIIATAKQAIQAITKPRWLQILLGFGGRFR